MSLAVVILAAGRGERMNSSLPKVLHKIFDKPMLRYVVDTASGLNPSKIVVVVGKNHKEIKSRGVLQYAPTKKGQRGIVSFAVQKEPKGTADALSKAGKALKGFKGTILVLNGDTPLITVQTLNKFLGLHRKGEKDISFISFIASNPAAYGRVIRDDSGGPVSIVEEKDATAAQKKIDEVNSGVYAIKSDMLRLLREIPLNALKGEYYLTDIIGIAKNKGYSVDAYCIGSEDEMMGINTVSELIKAQKMFGKKLIDMWINKGVRFLDPDSVFVSQNVIIGRETTIYPCVYLEGNTRIGKGCTVYPNVRIIDSEIRDGAVIKDSTVIEGSIVRAKALIGPFAHIRHGSDIGSEAKIGNFVEVKKSTIGFGTKASHLSYLGDASIGEDVNIGAGTITCNYDGEKKHRTTIEDNVFIGSDTQLIAPVSIGKGAYVGAGSTITKHVPSMSLAVSRVKQKNIEGWAIKRKIKIKNLKFKIKEKKIKSRQ
jgi:bifunctional UDP-N-acetylglucosamine pyrophosphorylase/glucosamine-1-phosphate N-acetyltransferase